MLNQAIPEADKHCQQIKKLLKDTDKENPNPKDVAALKKILDEKPEIFRHVGNLGNTVIERIIKDNLKLCASC